MFAWIGKGILALLSAIGPAVLRAWANVLRDETGKFYAQFRPLLIEACEKAGATITEETHPDYWQRRTARAKFVLAYVSPTITAQVGDVGNSLIFTAIEAAVAEIKGGWIK